MRQRKTILPPPLSADDNRRSVPFDVIKGHSNDFMSAKAQACQEQQDGEISAFDDCPAPATSKHMFDLARLDGLRQGGKPPTRYAWNGLIQSGGNFPANKKPLEEGPKGRHRELGSARSVSPRVLGQESVEIHGSKLPERERSVLESPGKESPDDGQVISHRTRGKAPFLGQIPGIGLSDRIDG
jgi:hypothetical protein